MSLKAGTFQESQHPRENTGKFADKPGGEAESGATGPVQSEPYSYGDTRPEGFGETPRPGRQKYRELAAAAKERLTSDQSDTVLDYTGSGYKKINAGLRSDRSLDGKTKKQIDDMDKAIAGSSFKEDTYLYRGAKIDAKTLKPGSTFVDKGFISTSVDRGVADEFADQSGAGIMMRITAKKGGKGLFAGAISVNPGEAEVILPRGSKFRVTKITGLDTNRPLVLAEVINNDN